MRPLIENGYVYSAVPPLFKLSRGKQDQQAALLSRQLGVPRDRMIVTSSETGQGIDELKSRIAEACL